MNANLLLSLVAKALLILAASHLLTALMRRASAAARHLVWTGAFAMLLLLPFSALFTPRLAVPVDFAQLAPAQFQAVAQLPPQEVRPTPSVVAPSAAPPQAASSQSPRIPWIPILCGVWILGSALALLRMAAAWLHMLRLRRRATAVRFDIPAPVAAPVLECAHEMPVVFGAMRPVVLMPAAAAHWSEERRRMVLLHEFAHIHRGDPATHLLARLALCLHWWNPLAHLAWRAFLVERERAADDMVLTRGEKASDYAGHLLEMARSLHTAPQVTWAAVAMVRTSQLEQRVKSILESGLMRRNFGRAASAGAVAVALCLSIPFAALEAQNVNTQVAPDVEATIREAAAKKNHEILDKAATHAEAMRQFDAARKLLDSALQMRAAKDGEKSIAYGIGLVKLADLERRRNNSVAAAGLYEKAVAVLGDRPESAFPLTYLGVIAASSKNLSKAEELLKRAQLLDPANSSNAMMWLALVYQTQGRASDAEGMFQAALVAEHEPTAQRATILDLFAGFLQSYDRGDEAKGQRERAAEIRKNLTKPSVKSSTAYRVGAGVTAPQLLSKVEPKYTDEARFAKFQGTVMLSVTVKANGEPDAIQVLRPLGLGLDDRAIDAVTQWRFKPGMKDGQPVDIFATIEINFRLL